MNEPHHLFTIYYVVIRYPLTRTYFTLDPEAGKGVKSPCQDKMREEKNKDSINMDWYHYKLALFSLDLQVFQPDSSVE